MLLRGPLGRTEDWKPPILRGDGVWLPQIGQFSVNFGQKVGVGRAQN